MERAFITMIYKLPAVGAGTCCLWHWLLFSPQAGASWMWIHLMKPTACRQAHSKVLCQCLAVAAGLRLAPCGR